MADFSLRLIKIALLFFISFMGLAAIASSFSIAPSIVRQSFIAAVLVNLWFISQHSGDKSLVGRIKYLLSFDFDDLTVDQIAEEGMIPWVCSLSYFASAIAQVISYSVLFLLLKSTAKGFGQSYAVLLELAFIYFLFVHTQIAPAIALRVATFFCFLFMPILVCTNALAKKLQTTRELRLESKGEKLISELHKYGQALEVQRQEAVNHYTDTARVILTAFMTHAKPGLGKGKLDLLVEHYERMFHIEYPEYHSVFDVLVRTKALRLENGIVLRGEDFELRARELLPAN